MIVFCNMDYDSETSQWWVDAFNNWPSLEVTRTYYNTKAEAVTYYNSIINNTPT